MNSDNLTKQREEVEAMSSIYGDEWITESEVTRSYSIRITENKNEVRLYVTMPKDYPDQSPAKYELSAPWMQRKAKTQLLKKLDEVCLEHVGEIIMYQWVETIREVIRVQVLKPAKKKVEAKLKLEINHPDPIITHGGVITDRRSSFQGHAAEVQSLEDVNAVLTRLQQNKKIMNATHNMYAYRIERKTAKGTNIIQDCDDDGEAHAGGRLLHLLQRMKQINTLVVVTRWKGGTQLGPDRFRHINNAARQVILEAGINVNK